MMNPFIDKARELAEKRDRWETLEIARDWIADHYDPGQVVLAARHNGASAVPGHKEAMAIICERLMGMISGRSDLVTMIDREMERVRVEATGVIRGLHLETTEGAAPLPGLKTDEGHVE